MKKFFEQTYKNRPSPVLVCECAPRYPLVYSNSSAKLLIDPKHTVVTLKERSSEVYLVDMLQFASTNELEQLIQNITTIGYVTNHRATLRDFEGSMINVSISANLIDDANAQYIVFYLDVKDSGLLEFEDMEQIMASAFHIAFHTRQADDAINALLAYVGSRVHVSRAYIFEETSVTTTRNTYEWCAPGVEPAIQDLQDLQKEDYNYDVIVSGGMYITDDIRDLPDNDREILEAQGIKSLAILPLLALDKPAGYMGFDDCEHYRKWSAVEIQLLSSISNIILSLLARRDHEQQQERSLSILQTITDNIDGIIYVTNPETYEVVFVNQTLAASLGKQPEQIVGKPCWSVLQSGFDGPCSFCPVPKLLAKEGLNENDVYVWEIQNTVTRKWYLVRDSIIKWIDGKYVHFESATEITNQKQYEEQLKIYASTDMMTGAYNREWGYGIIQDLIAAARHDGQKASLVFVDLDGLKFVNDNFGHDAGDEMILETVKAIRSCIRQTDFIVRWGGDEFLVLLRCPVEKAVEIMHGIQEKLSQANAEGNRPFRLSFSFGATSIGDDPDTSIDDIVTRADQSMYDHKRRQSEGR